MRTGATHLLRRSLRSPSHSAQQNPRPTLTPAALDNIAGDYGGPRLVFLNGHFAAQLSSLAAAPKGTEIGSFGSALLGDDALAALFDRSALRQHDGFNALNSALCDDGGFVRLPAGSTLEWPVHFVFVSHGSGSAVVSNPRSVVFAGANSRATVIETFVGLEGEGHLTNSVTQFMLDDGAVIEHYKLQDEPETAFHLALLDVRQARDSHFVSHSFAFGGSIARHEVNLELAGDGAEATLNGLFMPSGKQLHDNPTLIEHVAPHCTSRELYKGVVDGRGFGVFNGRIIVQPGADGTDASQTNKNLLLSQWAEVDTRPRLEILTDDVKCAHGAAVGQLDEDAVFYLRARGIPESSARGMLTHAFVNEMVGLVGLDGVRTRVEQLVALRLANVESTSSGAMADSEGGSTQ